MKKYLIVDFTEGNQDYDTLHIKVDEEIVQIPVHKDAKASSKVINKLLKVERLDTPVTKLSTEEVK